MSKLSIRIKELREEKSVSVKEMAKDLYVSGRTIQRWEKEERIPNADTVIMLAKYFKVSSDYLLGLED